MRISDWISDVCSSDLQLRQATRQANSGVLASEVGALRALTLTRESASSVRRKPDHGRLGVGGPKPLNAQRNVIERSGTADRKSVVSGKSVAVRVDLGGGRHLKKKQQHNNNNEI